MTVEETIGIPAAVEDMMERLLHVSNAVRSTGQSGSVTLRLSVKPMGRGDSVKIEAVVSQRSPESTPPSTPWEATLYESHGELVAEDPIQPRLRGVS